MRFRGGEFSTGTMGNFQPELTAALSRISGLTMGTYPHRNRGECLVLRPPAMALQG